jgi:ferredoxin-NADP reductase
MWQHATITRIETRSPRVKSFFFGLSTPITFQPGQHMVLRLTAEDGYRAQRSYSIASAPGGGDVDHLELAIEKYDDGEVSPFMHDVAGLDDRFELGGPIGGHFIWRPENDNTMLFMAGGSGVAPFMSMLRQRVHIASTVPVALLFSARQREDLLFLEELSRVADADKAFRLVPTLTREPDPHPFRSGRLDQAIIAAVVAAMPVAPRHVMICGSNAFVETAAEGAISASLDPSLIKTERYGGDT